MPKLLTDHEAKVAFNVMRTCKRGGQEVGCWLTFTEEASGTVTEVIFPINDSQYSIEVYVETEDEVLGEVYKDLDEFSSAYELEDCNHA